MEELEATVDGAVGLRSKFDKMEESVCGHCNYYQNTAEQSWTIESKTPPTRCSSGGFFKEKNL